MSRSQEQLAHAMAQHHFGPSVAEVVRLLLIYPSSSAVALVKYIEPFCAKHFAPSKDSQSTLKPQERIRLVGDSLAVLIQHEIVYYQEKPIFVPLESRKPSTKMCTRTCFEYALNIDNLLCRSRLPLYLGFARRRYGTVGEIAMRVLFERGRMTSSMIFQAALDDALPKLSITVADAQACLTDMAHSGLLHWSCRRGQSAGRKETTKSEPGPLTGCKRPRSSIDVDSSDSSDQSDDDDDDDDDSDDDENIIKIGQGNSCRKVGIPTRENDVDVWTICFWHLNREFRNECCVMVLHTRLGNELASRILRTGLQLALDGEDCNFPAEDFETGDIPIEAIQKQLESQSGNGACSEFWEAVQLLVNHWPTVVVPIPFNSPNKLRFVPGQLIADARQKTVDEHILKKFGGVGRRIFEAMAIEGGMQEQMLSDKCMLPIKVVREQLFKMYEDQIVTVLEVPRSHEQQRSNNWYYLWTVNMLAVSRAVVEVMYKTAHNLFLRLETVDLKSGSQAEQKMARLQETFLTGSILRMDQSIMVMRDFGALTAAYFPAQYTIMDGPIGKVKKKR